MTTAKLYSMTGLNQVFIFTGIEVTANVQVADKHTDKHTNTNQTNRADTQYIPRYILEYLGGEGVKSTNDS